MTRKTTGQNTGQPGCVDLSGPEVDDFDAIPGDEIKVEIANSKGIARALINNSDHNEFPIVFNPTTETKAESNE